MRIINLAANVIHMETISERNRVAGEVRANVARQAITLTSLGKRTGISTSSLSRKLRGEAPFTVDELYVIAQVLGVETATFFPTRVRLAVAS